MTASFPFRPIIYHRFVEKSNTIDKNEKKDVLSNTIDKNAKSGVLSNTIDKNVKRGLK